METLIALGKGILAVGFLVGMNVLAYCTAYVWGQPKPWYFWLCLSLTIIFVLMILSLAI